jgi:hypothetical protein
MNNNNNKPLSPQPSLPNNNNRIIFNTISPEMFKTLTLVVNKTTTRENY